MKGLSGAEPAALSYHVPILLLRRLPRRALHALREHVRVARGLAHEEIELLLARLLARRLEPLVVLVLGHPLNLHPLLPYLPADVRGQPLQLHLVSNA